MNLAAYEAKQVRILALLACAKAAEAASDAETAGALYTVIWSLNNAAIADFDTATGGGGGGAG